MVFMTNEALIRATWHGGRFKDGEIPLSVIADMVTLQEMMIDVAKWQFREDHTDRERTPRNFAQIYLKLTGLEKGSTIANIGIDTTRSVLSGVPNQEYFEKAVNKISDIIGCAEQDTGQPTIDLPKRFLSYFNRFGRNLGKDEYLEVKTVGRDPVCLTPESRERLVRHSMEMELMRDIALRGTVFEANQDKMTFSFRPIHGPQVNCRFTEQYRNEIITALKDYQNMKVLVHGTGIYDKQNRLSRIEPITHVEPLDVLDVPAQLDELRRLQDGWLEDGGKAPNHKGLDWLSETFGLYYPDDLPLPYVYPMTDGGITLEWSLDSRDVDIEVDIMAHKGEWYVYNTSTEDGEGEKNLNLNKSDDWLWFIKQIRWLNTK